MATINPVSRLSTLCSSVGGAERSGSCELLGRFDVRVRGLVHVAIIRRSAATVVMQTA
jgi:hypothetical protein